MFPVRQELRPAVTRFLTRLIELRNRVWRPTASILGNCEETGADRGRKQDGVVRSPGSPSNHHRAYVRNVQSGSAGGGNAPELAVGEEAKILAVRRPEFQRSAVGSIERLRLHRPE